MSRFSGSTTFVALLLYCLDDSTQGHTIRLGSRAFPLGTTLIQFVLECS